MQYSTVFDAAHQPTDWTPLILGGLVIAFGLAVVLRPKYFESRGMTNVSRRPMYRWSLLILGLLWTPWEAVQISRDADAAHQRAAQEGCSIVEGRVENFHPMPKEGHDDETFTVSGIGFHYSDYIIDGSFNNAASLGGPIRAHMPVRICERDGRIMKLEVSR